MNLPKPFTFEDVRKSPYRGEQPRRYHVWLKEQRKNDKKELLKEKIKKYRFIHKDELKEYKLKNKEKIKLWWKKYYLENKEKISHYQHEHYVKNKEKNLLEKT